MVAARKIELGGACALWRDDERTHAHGNLAFHHGQHIARVFAAWITRQTLAFPIRASARIVHVAPMENLTHGNFRSLLDFE